MSCKPIIMQGDQYNLEFSLLVDNEPIDMDIINTIQFVVGDLVKYYIKDDQTSEVTYDSTEKLFYFPLTEKDTFAFEGPQDCQIRIKFTDGNIKGTSLGKINLDFSITDEEIEDDITEELIENENENQS